MELFLVTELKANFMVKQFFYVHLEQWSPNHQKEEKFQFIGTHWNPSGEIVIFYLRQLKWMYELCQLDEFPFGQLYLTVDVKQEVLKVYVQFYNISVTTFDVVKLWNPWAIEIDIGMFSWCPFLIEGVLFNSSNNITTDCRNSKTEI